ncbi:hypothetical protein MKZ38_002752 [Zalerion maritima]|uniref:Protein kinase domain-containing protein n=1 Tax=Zalerion maritima TaxID=339359 RepID=A0AAD5RNI8_9PEZI|nr:hypothetical protein MKZ38_002752 [Zalerion maritima]
MGSTENMQSKRKGTDLREILPQRIYTAKFLSAGATCYVFQLTESIVTKYGKPRDSVDDQDGRRASYATPIANFLPYLAGGSLADRLRANAEWDRWTLLRVVRLEPRRLVERWAAQLSAADAWLETLGLVHNDLRPPNILLDRDDNLKLADFDWVEPAGRDCPGACAPWGQGQRELRQSWAADRDEPYEGMGPEAVDLFQAMRFPLLVEHDKLDTIINKCWRGRYTSVAELADETCRLPGAADMSEATALDAEYMAAQREECRRMIESGLLD